MENNLFYEIVDNTEDFIVINKYPDVSFHSENNEVGLFAKLKEDFKIPLFSIHRLDKITSGLILIAKSSKSASVLSILFSSRQIEKYYVAVSDKKPKKKQGIICGDMKKARRGQWKLCRTYENPAITRFSSLKYEDKYLFLLKPQTGKTHQIRVAMKSICAPIIGDVLYGGTVSDRGYLHSIKLSFSYKGKKYEYISYPNVGKFFIDEQLESLMSEIML
jgi:tRNA pseudouridine32 synthase/23S rRNA pseudouridine746 synthase